MPDLLRINVGCGQTSTPGWTNFDNSMTVRIARSPFSRFLIGREQFVRAVVANNIAYAEASSLPVSAGSARIIYSSHMLEHLDRREAGLFLQEAMRVLCSGGSIRIVVPDLKMAVEAYQNNGDADNFIEKLLMSRERSSSLGGRLNEAVVGFREHRWMYDASSLSKLLHSSGFVDVKVLEAGKTSITDVGELDLNERAEESLYVEATRP